MKKLQYTFKTDTLFKMLFVKYPELLKELVAELLGIPLESIETFTIKIRKCRRKTLATSSAGWISI